MASREEIMASDVSFETIRKTWLQLPREPATGRLLTSDAKTETLQMLIDNFSAPGLRWWFQACHAWLHGSASPDNQEIEELLGQIDAFRRRVAKTHIELTRKMLDAWTSHEPAQDDLAEFASAFGLRVPLVLDLVKELRTPQNELKLSQGILCGTLAKSAGSQIIPLLFVGSGSGVVADLVLGLLDKDEGSRNDETFLYPSPSMMFVERKEDFERAAETGFAFARRLMGSAGGADIRWRLALRGSSLHSLEGPSAGGAFALGVARLLADHYALSNSENQFPEIVTLLRNLDLSGVSMTAVIDDSGKLGPVGRTGYKLTAASLRDTFPRIHTVVVSEEQDIELQGIREDRQNPKILMDPHADFHILRAATLTSAVELLVLDAKNRWQDIINCREVLEENRNFIGREWLKNRVQRFQSDLQRRVRYFLITGEPGAGKTAFVADCLRSDPSAVYHFIRKGRWDEPDAFFRSLTAQLRRKHGLLQTEEEIKLIEKEKYCDEFYCVLASTSRKLDGKQEVLWLDGLDEAYGPTGRHAGVALPGPLRGGLPKGIFFVLTSRPGSHLSWLADPELCETVRLEDEAESNATDVRAYFEERNRAEGLGLTEEFIDRALSKSENNFLFAVKLVDDLRTLSPEERTADRIPDGLRGWMVKQLQYVIDTWIKVNE
jgi:hypothetical protein